MNITMQRPSVLIATALASLFLVACAAKPVQPEVVNNARIKLTKLQADQPLASQAPVAIKDAEDALRAAEAFSGDKERTAHLMYIAESKVDTAQALAESRQLVVQRTALSQQRESARLDSRTQEADVARSNADAARIQALAAQKEAENARSRAEAERMKTLAAQQDTANAQQTAAAAQQKSDDLQSQIAALNAKPTERGLVVTLGDVLFDTDKSVLKSGAATNLAKLATFLNQYPDRSVIIEGHTDTVGNADYNQALSQRRADAVKGWLMKQGVASDRVVTAGKGEVSPVAGNDSASGRQLNRRVEVIIENPRTPAN